MITENEIKEIGNFQRTHALKGELNAILDVDIDFFEADVPLIVDVDGIYVPFYVESIRPKGKTSCLIKLDGVDDVSEAEMFVNKTIFALKSDIQEYRDSFSDDDEDGEPGGYAEDFVGYKVYATDGRYAGEISDIDLSTPNALFILEQEDGKNIYIPVAEEFITEIDDENRKIVMDLPEGLIEINN